MSFHKRFNVQLYQTYMIFELFSVYINFRFQSRYIQSSINRVRLKQSAVIKVAGEGLTLNFHYSEAGATLTNHRAMSLHQRNIYTTA